MKTVQQQFSVSYSYPVLFTRGVFEPENPALAELLHAGAGKRARALVVVDSGLLAATPGLLERISRYGAAHRERLELILPPVMVRGGEICKREPVEVERIQALVERLGLCRHSFVLALGGGAVLDAAGFAAATSHRGVRLVRLPSTTLAQNDAGIGVKNGVNAFGRKNFLGTFAPPFAVVNDLDFLKTLPPRELRGGYAEAVKVALIRDRAFFDWIYANRGELARFGEEAMEQLIVRCAELHLAHIAGSGDPFEFGSSRPLDFGHWCAHKLEELTGGELRHGEAVAIGIALDSVYSRRRGLISELELHRILVTLEDLGFALNHLALRWIDLEQALREFQEHLGGELSLPLLQGIGNKIEVQEIDGALYRDCLALLFARKRPEQGESHELEQRSTQRV